MKIEQSFSTSNSKVFNLRFHNALQKRAQSIPPIWFMRQAGRYHNHYQNLRKKYSFVELCKNPELAAEVALGPIRDFDFDVAILFSDILFPLETMGLGLHYKPGPIFDQKMDLKKLKQLRSLEEMENDLDFQRKALICTRNLLPHSKSLIGFIGGPWTLFSYAVTKEHKESFLKQDEAGRELFVEFFKSLMPLLLRNIQLQIKGGAEVVMIFDSSVFEMSENLFLKYLLPFLKELTLAYPLKLAYYNRGLQEKSLKEIKDLPWAGLGFDHQWSMDSFPPVRSRGFFQGHFNPSLMLQSFFDFKKSFEVYLNHWLRRETKERLGWVCSLGHGVLPKTPERNVKYFVETVRKTFSY